MVDPLLLTSFGVALLAGLLIGFERDLSKPSGHSSSSVFAGGARTHGLVALLGAIAMALEPHAGPAPVVIGFAALAGLVALAYHRDLSRAEDPGRTSEIAFLATYLLGALSTSTVIPSLVERAVVVMASAVAITALLTVKPSLHALAHRVSREDIASALKFLAVAVVLLPLLPDTPLGPYDAIRPFRVGLMIALIIGVDFAAYVAVRWLGDDRGLVLTGLVGGLASSTAVTLAMAGRVRDQPEARNPCAMAVLLASVVMLVRVIVLVAVISPALIPALIQPLVMMMAAGGVACLILWLQQRGSEPKAELELSRPVTLTRAVRFGLLFLGISVLAAAASAELGEAGSYLAGAIGGSTSMDAVTLSMAHLAQDEQLSAAVAATAIALGAMSNSLVKAGLSTAIGGWAFGLRVFGGLALTAAAGAGGIAILQAGLLPL